MASITVRSAVGICSGFLVVLEDTRQQETDDEDGATNAACHQPVEVQELESEIMNHCLGATEQQYDGADREEQTEFLPEAEFGATERKMRANGGRQIANILSLGVWRYQSAEDKPHPAAHAIWTRCR